MEKVGLLGGTGEEGRGIALRLARGGVEAVIGSRQSDRAARTAQELNRQLGEALITGASNREVADLCSMLFLTVPFRTAENLILDLGDRLTPRHLIVDVTVPLSFNEGPALIDLGGRSAAESLRETLAAPVGLTATFKTIPAHLMVDAQSSLDCDEFICYDSPANRDRLLAVVKQIEGVRWIDAGPLSACRSLEAMTLLVIQLNRRYKKRFGRYRIVGI